MKNKWLPWVIVVGGVVVIVIVLLVINPPFLQNLLGESAKDSGGEDAKVVVARVGSEKLTLKEYKDLVGPYAIGQVEPLSVINPWVQQEIIYQLAKEEGLDKRDTVRMALDQLKLQYEYARKQILQQAWMNEEAKNVTVTPQEAQAYFKNHKDEFLYDVKVSQILVTDPTQVNGIYQQLEMGEDFKELAQLYTQDALKGEPSGFISRGSGQFTLPMEEAIFSLKPGEYTEPIITPDGAAFIFKLVDKVKVRKDMAYTDVAEYLELMLRYEKAQKVILDKVDSLMTVAREKSEIEINPENIR
ncbi:peptidyl-prolyl cis-trans isomerase [candidate division WOR-3 bacterium]|nr:peptidyl-prolyl cis-trans isomerase [candidate division WOR-3 bacterium]